MGELIKKALTDKSARNKKALKEIAVAKTQLTAWGAPI